MEGIVVLGQGDVVALGQCEQNLRGERALQVHVMLALGELLKERVECGFAHVVVVVVDDDDMRRTRLWSDEIAIRDTDGTRIRIKGL
mgnify:CR=1 FL=1